MNRWWVILTVAILLLPAVSNAGPVVYPVRAVIGFNDRALAEKAPVFANWVNEVSMAKLADDFVSLFRKEFGDIAVATVDEKNKHRVIVASLHLVRASQYTVPKAVSGCTEYQLPLTLSIVFTNPTTGEVIYSFTRTSYAPVEVADMEEKALCDLLLRKATENNYWDLVAGLVKEARQGYNPTQIDASIVKIWKGLFILDRGSKFGIAQADSLVDPAGNEIQVKYVTEDYAVAVPLLAAKIEAGQKFSKYANQSIAKTVKKPKVLSMHGGWGDDQLKAIAGFFDSGLSKESAFTLLPVNESLATLLTMVATETNIGQFQVTNQRMLPDYLIKFTYASPRVYDIGQEGKFGFHIYEQYVLGELLDKQGRIVYSAVGKDKIEEKNVGGMVFSKEARLEILLKNAVTQLAEQFSRSIKFASFVLPITKVEGERVELDDVAHQLRSNQNVLVFRNIGSVDGVDGDVLVPIQEAQVVDATGGRVKITLLGPVTEELKDMKVTKKDVVLVSSISAGTSGESDTSVSYCSELPSKIGALEMEDFPLISRGFGYLLPYSLYDNDAIFFDKVLKSIRFGGFNNSLKLGSVDTAGRCLLPVQRTSIENRQCENGDCSAEVLMAIGYRLYEGKDKKGGAASETKLSIKQIREPAFDSVIQSEISSNALELLKANVAKTRYN